MAGPEDGKGINLERAQIRKERALPREPKAEQPKPPEPGNPQISGGAGGIVGGAVNGVVKPREAADAEKKELMDNLERAQIRKERALPREPKAEQPKPPEPGNPQISGGAGGIVGGAVNGVVKPREAADAEKKELMDNLERAQIRKERALRREPKVLGGVIRPDVAVMLRDSMQNVDTVQGSPLPGTGGQRSLV